MNSLFDVAHGVDPIPAKEGKPNELSSVGKTVLERLNSKQYPRNVRMYSTLCFHTERAKCLRKGVLFEDYEFPASKRSIYYSRKPDAKVVWKRPGEIVPAPQFIAAGQSRFDVNQGNVGNCWFLAALVDLTLHDELFYRVVPPDQDFTKENYAGIFHFQFWRHGEWVDVVIDDRLPVFEADSSLFFTYSKDPNEFWSALLEKAYAKMNRSYEHLKLGYTNEALQDFTGGVTQHHIINSATHDLIFNLVSKHLKTSLFGVVPGPDEKEKQLENGLVRGHAYSVTAVERVVTKKGPVVLVRLRNPWGNEVEWAGRFSDNSADWNDVPEKVRDSLLRKDKDGEFWMPYEDLMQQFNVLEECHLPERELKDIEELTGLPMERGKAAALLEVAVHGSWSYLDRMTTARCYTPKGCNNPSVCLSECPQYLLTVKHDRGPTVPKDWVFPMEPVFISLLQKHRRELKHKGARTLRTGLLIYNAPKGTKSRVDATFIMQNKTHRYQQRTALYYLREYTVQTELLPGDYIVIPFKAECYWDCDFLLRIFSEANLQLSLLK